MKRVTFLLLVILLITACKNNGDGQLVGVKNRPTFVDVNPYGMVYIPAGHFLMGAGDQDVPFALTHQSKNVTISAFWMDETEITNNEYRQFVNWVRDSIAHVLLGEAGDIDGVGKRGHYLKYGKGHESEGEVMEPKLINWDEDIPWASKNEDVTAALSPLFIKINTRFYHYRPPSLNISMLNYEYWTIDRSNQADRKDPSIFGAAVKEKEGSDIGGIYANRPSHINNGVERFIRRNVINIYPDTLCWNHDYTYSMNDPMTLNYFDHPNYDHYPVVGVSWMQTQAFVHWRTQLRQVWLQKKEYATEQEFRLPTEGEWEMAARGGHANQKYPWGGNYTTNSNGCFLSNFKPQRGNYIADDNFYTSIVAHYHPNDRGLYDMAGNVAEWCNDAFDNSSVNFTHDLNPSYTYYAKKTDTPEKKRKVVRGGSWKDIAYYTTVYAKTYEYQDTCKSYIGFRCVQSYLGRNRGDASSRSSHVY